MIMMNKLCQLLEVTHFCIINDLFQMLNMWLPILILEIMLKLKEVIQVLVGMTSRLPTNTFAKLLTMKAEKYFNASFATW